MKKRSYLFVLVVLALILASCGGPKSSPSPSEQANREVDAAQVYKQSCVSCHGVKLEGRMGPALSDVGARLKEEEILAVITQGRNGMPSFGGRLTDKEITALAVWLAQKKE